jgi:hypothetical protein
MGLFFQIIGIIAFSIVLAILVAFLWLRWKIKRVFRDLEQVMESTGRGIGPRRIHLRRIDAPAEDEIEDCVRQLERLGYQRMGDYEIDEMGGLRLVGFTDPSAGAMAALYDHPVAGVVCDLVVRYQDGSALTVTNAPTGHELDQREGHPRVFRPGVSIPELQRILASERRMEPTRVWSREEWAAGFERAYAEDMEWRLAKGVSGDEVRRVARGMGGDFEDGVIDVTVGSLQAHRVAELSQACLETYLDETDPTDEEWEHLEERVRVVHDAMDTNDAMTIFFELLGGGMIDEASLEAVERLSEEGLPARVLIERALQLVPGHARYRRLGSVDEPVAADLWEMARNSGR